MSVMPYTVAVSFDKFIENISLTGDHNAIARARRDKIVELLSGGFTILDAFPTGSLIRHTGLRGSSDVDVVVVLHYGKHIKDKTPRRVLEDVRSHLSQYNAQLVKKNGQAVTLYFETWPNVDIVPASRTQNDDGSVSYYSIPDMNRGVWIRSRPRRHDTSMSKLTLEGRQRIRMAKEWNRAHSGYLQSFHIEVIALHAPATSGNWPWDVYRFFDAAASSFASPLYHPNAPMGPVDDYLTGQDRTEARNRLDRAKDLANKAWYAAYKNEHEEAIRLYRILFGDRFPAYG